MTGKIIFSDRFIFIILIASVSALLFTAIAFFSANNFERKNKELKKQLTEMQGLKEELSHVKDIVESKEKKIGLTKISGVVPALEQMLNGLGLKAKMIKSLEKKRLKEFTEEDAELEIEGIDLNKVVNLLYRIENSPVPLKIKNVAVKPTFKNPDVFILSMTVSLIGKTK